MQLVEARELGDRRRMVVDAQVDGDVARPAVASRPRHHEERGRLLAAAIAAGRLRGRERGQQALGQRPAGGLLERLAKALDRLLVRRGCCPAPRSPRPSRRRPSRDRTNPCRSRSPSPSTTPSWRSARRRPSVSAATTPSAGSPHGASPARRARSGRSRAPASRPRRPRPPPRARPSRRRGTSTARRLPIRGARGRTRRASRSRA